MTDPIEVCYVCTRRRLRCRLFDGQNLFHCAKAAFGYTYPNYDPLALASKVITGK